MGMNKDASESLAETLGSLSAKSLLSIRSDSIMTTANALRQEWIAQLYRYS